MTTPSTKPTITLEDLLASDESRQLDQLLQQASEEYDYANNLMVAWSYWHYGRHAEYAEELGMPALARLFSAAWSIEYDVHDKDVVAANAARESIRRKYGKS